MSQFSVLSPPSFEDVVADLLHAQTGADYEPFALGAEGGVDLRRRDETGIEIVQAKRYDNSTFPHLLAVARAERPKLDALDPLRTATASSHPAG